MKARLFINLISTGDRARNYLRLVKGPRRHQPVEALDSSNRGEAHEILETIQNQNEPYELDINIKGKNLINQMDRDFEDMELVPYWYTDLARSRGEGIYPGVSVIITGDPSRERYRTLEVSLSRQAIRIEDTAKNEFILPLGMVVPVQGQEKDRPYWFTALARERGEDLQVGDYVRVGTDEKYELMDVFWEYGEVRVRAVGSVESQVMPWRHIRP
jgi:hypothetical protein